MPQYLLNIIQPDGEVPEPEFLEPVMRELKAFNDELRAAGAWVFSAGLHDASTATVVRREQRQDAAHRRPVRRGQRARRRLHDRRRA